MRLAQRLRSNIVQSRCNFFSRTTKTKISTSASSRPELDPLFDYTSGRWLWDEREQLALRHRHFDVPSLQRAACQAVGTKSCNSIEKIGEGNSNKVYRLQMEDGRSVIAKVPHPNAGPAMLTTSSEVATMQFARDVLKIPVPRVLAWCATDTNPVEAEYIIMEEAQGSSLEEVWESLSLRKKVDVVREIVNMEKKLLSMSFDRCGSLYLSDSGIGGCEPAIVANIPQETADHIASRYSIGPITRTEFWQGERSQMKFHGPWTSATAYLESVANREIDWIKSHAKLPDQDDKRKRHRGLKQRAPEEHIALLEKFLSAIPLITPKDSEISSFRLWHPDFHAGNVYVDDEGRISCIIDWQGAWTTPVFIGANPPWILDYAVEKMLELPDDFKTLDDATKKDLRYRVSQTILIQAYETWTAEENPVMYKMMRHPHGQTLKQLEAFAGSSWHDGLFPFEECLISVEREWSFFNIDQPCPYHISTDQVERHNEMAIVFRNSQVFWNNLRTVVSDDGYTSNETFDKATEELRRQLKLGT